MLSDIDERRAGASLVLVGELETCDRAVAAQIIMHADTKCARPLAVDYQNLLETGKLRVVNEFAANLLRLVNRHAANID